MNFTVQYQVPAECSVGVLWATLHRDHVLQAVSHELQSRAVACGLFERTGVSGVLLHARVGKDRARPGGVVVDEHWRFLAADYYWAFVAVDLSEWTTKSATRTPGEALAGAMPVLTRLGWLGLAQVAVELGVDADRIAAFLEGSPVSCEELAPRSKRPRKRPKPKPVLEVQVLFRAEDPNQQLRERSRIDETLRNTASRLRGSYLGSSSSDEHFSFEFQVSNLEKARSAFSAALLEAGVPADATSFFEV